MSFFPLSVLSPQSYSCGQLAGAGQCFHWWVLGAVSSFRAVRCAPHPAAHLFQVHWEIQAPPAVILMAKPGDSGTRLTLLQRLARADAPDQEAWSEFVEHYGRKIYQWCARWGLQPADAEDVTQTVLLKLAERMKNFAYDPNSSFRAWLKTVTHHAWRDFVDGRRKPGRGQGSDETLDQMQTIAAREDLTQRLEEQFDLELLEKAKQLVRLQTAPHNWQAFCLTVLEGVAAADVAERLEMPISRVYAARSRVQQRLKEECRRLDGGEA